MKTKKLIGLLMLSILILSGCGARMDYNNEDKLPDNTDTNTFDPATGIFLEGQGLVKDIPLDEVTSIELIDLEDTIVKAYDENEITEIIEAYNGSMLDDVSYIEMITGNRMIITLNSNEVINIHSYGNEDRIVVSGGDYYGHVINSTIGKILLEEK